MQKAVICVLCSMAVFLQACRTVTHQSMSEIENGLFKVMIRTQEFNNSGSDIVDICVANTSSHKFPDNPDKTSECFLNGYDFSNLSVKWEGAGVIQVSFRSGRVVRFTNSAVAYPGGDVPKGFHTYLCDGCDRESKDPSVGDVKKEPAKGLTSNH